MYEGRAVCVTGGAGFIGGHLIDALHCLGASISVLDDLSNATLDHLSGLIDIDPERVRFVHGSILEDAALEEAISLPGKTPVVFHLAAVNSVPRSVEAPERTWAVNATGTLRVLRAAQRAEATRVVYAASSSAYGETLELPKRETATPNPTSPYGAAKLAGEQLCRVWSLTYGLDTACMRYFNVFGPRQPADSPYSGVVAAFARMLLAGEPPVVYGDGTQTRDFTFVGNAVLATLLAGVRDTALQGEPINVATGRRISIQELASLMAERCGVMGLEPVHKPVRRGDIRHSQADISRARERLGYDPMFSLEHGLEETVAWYRGVYARA